MAAIDRPVRGGVVTPDGGAVDGLEVLVGTHPIPSEASARAGGRLLELSHSATPGTSVLVLLSGGASSLCSVPPAGIEVDDIGMRRPTLDDVFLSLTGHVADEGSGGEAAASPAQPQETRT